MPSRILVLYGSYRAERAGLVWHGTLAEMGMAVISSQVTVGQIEQTLDADGTPTGEGGKALERAFMRFADDLDWWMETTKEQRQRKSPPF